MIDQLSMTDFSTAKQLHEELRAAHWEKDGKLGMNAYGYTPQEQEAIDIIVRKAMEFGMETFSDLAGNMYMIKRGHDSSKTNVVLSHMDTVENGGAYDGRDGVVAGLVVAHWLKDITPPNDFCVMIPRSEESCVNGQVSLGAKLATGGLSSVELKKLTNRIPPVRPVIDHMKDIGIEIAEIPGRLDAGPTLFPTGKDAKDLIGELIEAHIEQGKYCAHQNISVGVVTSIRGNTRIKDMEIKTGQMATVDERLTGSVRVGGEIHGEAAHSGATFEEHRADTVRTCGRLLQAAEEWYQQKRGGRALQLVAHPIGVPNQSPTTVPNYTEFALEVRSNEPAILDEFAELMRQKTAALQAADLSGNLTIDMQPPAITQPAPGSPKLAPGDVEDHLDAMRVYGQLLHAAEQWFQQKHGEKHDIVFTAPVVGGSLNTAHCMMEIRSNQPELLREFSAHMQSEVTRIEASDPSGRLQITLPEPRITDPAVMSKEVIDHAREAAEQLGIKAGDVISGAGHDAGQFANKGARGVMLFIRQDKPLSHNPDEARREDSFQDACKIIARMVMTPRTAERSAGDEEPKSFRKYLTDQGAEAYKPGQWLAP